MNKTQKGKEALDLLFGVEGSSSLYNFFEKTKKGYGDYLLYSCGEFYGDETLDIKTKQLIVITTLITQKGAFPQLRNHLQGCKNVGLTRAEVCAAITHLTMYIGFPTVVNAMEVVNDVYKENAEGK